MARLTCGTLAAGQALPAAARTPPAPLPGSVAAELVHVLAAVALAGT